MNNTVSVTLKGHRFTLTREELQSHILACCDAGIAHFSVPPASVKTFTDKTQAFRGDDAFSYRTGARSNGPNESVDY